MTTARFRTIFLTVALIGLTAKLLAVADREILPRGADAWGYIVTSLGETQGDPGHATGTALPITLARALGIPYRPFQEVMIAAALTILLLPLVRSRTGLVAGCVIYVLCLFSPTIVLAADFTLSEVPFITFVVVSWGGVVAAATSETRSGLATGTILAAGGAALAAITRSEGPVFVASAVLTAGLAFAVLQRFDRPLARRATFACIAAAIAMIAAGQARNAHNAARYGYWSASYTESRQWFALYGTLLSLPGERIPGAGVTDPAPLRAAGELSPTLESIRPCVEDLLGRLQIQWAVRQCLPGTPKAKVRATRRIVKEIRLGAAAQGIGLEHPLLDIIPHPILRWLPEYPSALWSIIQRSAETPTRTRAVPPPIRGDPDRLRAIYERGALLRTSLAMAGENPEVGYFSPPVAAAYRVVGLLGLPAALLFLCVAAFLAFRPVTTNRSQAPILLVGLLVASFIVLRLPFYAIVEWMLWRVADRYLDVNRFLYPICVVACTVLGLHTARLLLAGRRRRIPPGVGGPTTGGHDLPADTTRPIP